MNPPSLHVAFSKSPLASMVVGCCRYRLFAGKLVSPICSKSTIALEVQDKFIVSNFWPVSSDCSVAPV